MPGNPDLRNDQSISQITRQSSVQAEDFASRVVPRASQGRGNLTQAIANYQSTAAAVGNLRFPTVVGKYYAVIQIADYNRTGLGSVNFNPTDRVVLPMPPQLVNHDSVKYDEAQVGMFTGGAINSDPAGVISRTVNRFRAGGSPEDLRGAIGDAIASGGALAGGIAADAAGGLAGAAAGGAINGIEALAGYSPNQFFTVLLIGPNYSNYQLMWGLYPKNQEESDAIREIYYKLQNAKAPSGAFGGLLWKFPKIFRVEFYPKCSYLYKFKPSVLEDVQFNFAPSGSPAFYGDSGAPEAVIMTLSFKEIEYWLASDYINDDNPANTLGGARGV